MLSRTPLQSITACSQLVSYCLLPEAPANRRQRIKVFLNHERKSLAVAGRSLCGQVVQKTAHRLQRGFDVCKPLFQICPVLFSRYRAFEPGVDDRVDNGLRVECADGLAASLRPDTQLSGWRILLWFYLVPAAPPANAASNHGRSRLRHWDPGISQPQPQRLPF